MDKSHIKIDIFGTKKKRHRSEVKKKIMVLLMRFLCRRGGAAQLSHIHTDCREKCLANGKKLWYQKLIKLKGANKCRLNIICIIYQYV